MYNLKMEISKESLNKHIVAIGNSGSGKTFMCIRKITECLMLGIPVIAIDTQGDLSSMSIKKERDSIEDKHAYDYFWENTDISVFTPSSNIGHTMSVNPFKIKDHSDDYEIDLIATAIRDLLGFSSDNKYSDEIKSLIFITLKEKAEKVKSITSEKNFSGFTDFSKKLLETGQRENLCSKSILQKAVSKAKTLSIGVNKYLFEDGEPLDINKLIRCKTPKLSIINLTTINSEEEKHFFLSYLSTELYKWMIRNPSNSTQAMLFIDECGQFIPPVKKPAAKEILSLLFKQARKFGISCMLATQNPGDIDYKCIDQFSTWYIGRLIGKTGIKKVQSFVEAKCFNPDYIMKRIPGLDTGEFILISPDNFDEPQTYISPEIFCNKKVMTDDEISKLTYKDEETYNPFIREGSDEELTQIDISAEHEGYDYDDETFEYIDDLENCDYYFKNDKKNKSIYEQDTSVVIKEKNKSEIIPDKKELSFVLNKDGQCKPIITSKKDGLDLKKQLILEYINLKIKSECTYVPGSCITKTDRETSRSKLKPVFNLIKSTYGKYSILDPFDIDRKTQALIDIRKVQNEILLSKYREIRKEFKWHSVFDFL